ncbi:MAG: efflux transporter outer membrane subunit [Sphingomonas sp.]|uniref:efflux transporter outer membrane subunit n=1 Tax=Sphingomonas sp. TaxID=28214 RepID=UPI002275C727|nr:efflux transporter outer membrane subunit [Sphingomonas sp.]MCX8476276.1 efflux transporter outer membrane subunit [Sphingomonas sp.]
MKMPLLALLAGASLLAGCNLAPEHVRPEGAIPAALPQGGVYPPAATDAPDVSTIGWRDFFVDPKLRDTIALGLENNRDLRIAAANVLQARAQYRVQRADQLPTVRIGASATVANAAGATASGGTAGGDTVETYSANVGVSAFELDLFGRVRNLSRAALEQYFATEEAQRAARISLIAEIASAWLTLASDQDQLAIARDTLESYRQSLELTRAQFRIGTSSELAVRQADTLYQGARNDIASLQTQIARDQNALQLLVGAPLAPALLPQGLGEEVHTLSDLPANLSSAVLLRRPDVLQAEHQLIAQNANIGAARAAMFPTISLTASLGTISTALSGLFGSGSESWSAGPSASLPIFDFGRRKGNVHYAEASQKAAIATYERTLQTAFREVADALALRGTIGEQLAAQNARAESAQIAARISDTRFRTGVDSFLTSLDAQRTAYAARQQLVTARLTHAANLVELYRALGGGLT